MLQKGSFIEWNCCWRRRERGTNNHLAFTTQYTIHNALLLKSRFTSCSRVNLFQLCSECLVNTGPKRKILFLEIKLLESYCAGEVHPTSSSKLWWCRWTSTKGISQTHRWQTKCFTPFCSSRRSDFSQTANPWATDSGQPWPADCSSLHLRCRIQYNFLMPKIIVPYSRDNISPSPNNSLLLTMWISLRYSWNPLFLLSNDLSPNLPVSYYYYYIITSLSDQLCRVVIFF